MTGQQFTEAKAGEETEVTHTRIGRVNEHRSAVTKRKKELSHRAGERLKLLLAGKQLSA